MRFAVVLLTFCIGTPALAEDTIPSGAPVRPVITVIVGDRAALPLSYVGVVVASSETDLGFPMIGTVAERPVQLGDEVTRGETLAHLDTEDLDADLRAAEANVSVAEAQRRSASDARDRSQELLARGVGSAIRLEDAERTLVAADAGLEQARAALARATDLRRLASLVAPFEGVVTEVFAEPGATLSAGQPILRLAATGEREVVIDLSEPDAAVLKPGVRLTASLDANASISATVVLDRIDPVAERTTRTRRVHLTLESAPPEFRLGALVHVVPMLGAEAGILLPSTALLDTGAVWVIDRSSDRIGRRTVTIGEDFGEFVVVTEGLKPGDEVLTHGIHSVEDGQIVGPKVSE